MTKKNGFGISKKGFDGLERIYSEEIGKRVWMYKSKPYESLRELDMSVNPYKYFNKNLTFKPVSNNVTTTNDFVETESQENQLNTLENKE